MGLKHRVDSIKEAMDLKKDAENIKESLELAIDGLAELGELIAPLLEAQEGAQTNGGK